MYLYYIFEHTLKTIFKILLCEKYTINQNLFVYNHNHIYIFCNCIYK